MDYGTVMGWVRARLSFGSFVLHCCMFGGLVLSDVLVVGASIAIELVSLPFVLLSILNCLVSMIFLCAGL